MRKSAELPNLVLAAIGAGTWDLNMETNIVGHNEVFSKIAGITDGLLEHPYPLKSFFIHPDDIGGVLQKVSAAVEAGSSYTATYRLCRADGLIIRRVEIHFCLSGSPGVLAAYRVGRDGETFCYSKRKINTGIHHR